MSLQTPELVIPLSSVIISALSVHSDLTAKFIACIFSVHSTDPRSNDPLIASDALFISSKQQSS